jgi:hypothetical protein
MRRLAIENADAFVLVYSVVDASSFEQVRRLRDEIMQIKREQLASKSRFVSTPNGRTRSQTVHACMPVKESPLSCHRKHSVGAFCSPKASIRRRSCVDSLSEQLSQQLVRNLELQKKLFPVESNDLRLGGNPAAIRNQRRASAIEASMPAEQKLAVLRTAWRTDVAKLFGHADTRLNPAPPMETAPKSKQTTNSRLKETSAIHPNSSVETSSVFSETSSDSEARTNSKTKSNQSIPKLEDEVIQTDDQLKRIPLVVVGNKLDLVSNRAVSQELAETLVTMDWEAGFEECSAKSNTNVTAIFKQLLQRTDLPPVAALAFEERTCRRKSLPAYQSPIARERLKPKRNSCALS